MPDEAPALYAEITRLRAEVERLNKSRNKWGQKYNTLLEQHKVTVSQLKAAVWSDSEECKLLTAENEKLKEQLESPFMDGYETAKEEYRPRLIAAEAENERLTAQVDTAAEMLREAKTRNADLTARVKELEGALSTAAHRLAGAMLSHYAHEAYSIAEPRAELEGKQ